VIPLDTIASDISALRKGIRKAHSVMEAEQPRPRRRARVELLEAEAIAGLPVWVVQRDGAEVISYAAIDFGVLRAERLAHDYARRYGGTVIKKVAL
jgi:hypothetical protein